MRNVLKVAVFVLFVAVMCLPVHAQITGVVPYNSSNMTNGPKCITGATSTTATIQTSTAATRHLAVR
jgi:hypothetical protein